jgi:regulator of sigma D
MITCPNCGQPFRAILEQVLDVGVDPSAKERLLGGRANAISCPQCGYRGMVSIPLMYHDPAKQLAIVFVPMELNLDTPTREKLIGDMTAAVMRTLPEDAPKGYLLQPAMALTYQGLLDQVLEADGITREMIEAETRKLELVEQLSRASREEAEQLLVEHAHLLDRTFIELLTAAAQAASQANQSREALRLFNIQKKLMETTDAGREMQRQQQALMEASQELQSLGESLTREAFVDLLINAIDESYKLDALVTLARGLLDYTTFQVLTNRIEQEPDSGLREKLVALRERLLALAAEYERQSKQIIEQAVSTLRMLLQAPDLQTAIMNNLNRIDQTFLTVLQANLDEARRTGNVEASSRLDAIRNAVRQIVEAAAPPEIQFINALLSVETEQESLEILHQRREELTPELLAIMDDLVGQLREAGNDRVAERVALLLEEAHSLV